MLALINAPLVWLIDPVPVSNSCTSNEADGVLMTDRNSNLMFLTHGSSDGFTGLAWMIIPFWNSEVKTRCGA